MKLLVLSLVAIVFTTSAYAQRLTVGPRYNPPGTSRTPTYTQYPSRHQVPDYRSPTYYPDYRTTSRPVVVGPRYNPPSSRRVIRTVRRSPVIWNSGFGYSCGYYGDLTLNGRLVHNFRWSSDCSQALSDIRNYGDFCDGEELYDQSGMLEARFSFSSECRSALGWYY